MSSAIHRNKKMKASTAASKGNMDTSNDEPPSQSFTLKKNEGGNTKAIGDAFPRGDTAKMKIFSSSALSLSLVGTSRLLAILAITTQILILFVVPFPVSAKEYSRTICFTFTNAADCSGLSYACAWFNNTCVRSPNAENIECTQYYDRQSVLPKLCDNGCAFTQGTSKCQAESWRMSALCATYGEQGCNDQAPSCAYIDGVCKVAYSSVRIACDVLTDARKCTGNCLWSNGSCRRAPSSEGSGGALVANPDLCCKRAKALCLGKPAKRSRKYRQALSKARSGCSTIYDADMICQYFNDGNCRFRR